MGQQLDVVRTVTAIVRDLEDIVDLDTGELVKSGQNILIRLNNVRQDHIYVTGRLTVAIIVKYEPDIAEDIADWIKRLRHCWKELTWSVCSKIRDLERELQSNKD